MMNRTGVMRRAVVLILTLCMAMSLVACGSKKKSSAVAIDPATAAAEITGCGAFTQDLAAADQSYISTLLGLDPSSYTDAAYYVGDGVSTESVAVFKTASNKAAKSLKSTLKAYNDQQIETYSSYNPAEVPKLQNAIIRTNGKYVCYVVANDAKTATKTVKKYFPSK